MSLFSSSQWDLIAGVLLLILVVFAARTIYSVYFGPLSKFPGPKLAAATLCYEFYYDVIRQGQYTFKLRELHEKYGMSLKKDFPPDQLTSKARSFESVRMNSISMNLIITRSCILIRSREINTLFMWPNSVSRAPVSRQSTTNFIVLDGGQ